jgi:hypothetical protein
MDPGTVLTSNNLQQLHNGYEDYEYCTTFPAATEGNQEIEIRPRSFLQSIVQNATASQHLATKD